MSPRPGMKSSLAETADIIKQINIKNEKSTSQEQIAGFGSEVMTNQVDSKGGA